MSESEKSKVVRAYRRGDATRADVRDVFGGDIGEFEDFEALMDLVDSTPTNNATGDLFTSD